jgi:hypothetical protein
MDCVSDGFERGGTARGENYCGVFTCAGLGDAAPDALAGTRDNDHLVA